jgi:hypothetical protein
MIYNIMNCIIRSAVLPAAPSPVGHSLFQSADGRIFALSTSDNTIQPGDTLINTIGFWMNDRNTG